MKELSVHLLTNIAYLTSIIFFISKSKISSKLLTKEKFKRSEKVLLIIFFSLASIVGTYIGVDYKGAIANTRNIGVIAGGLIGGPIAGIIIGLLAGIHRYLIDLEGITSLPCSLATILGGLFSGIFYKIVNKKNRKYWGFLLGLLIENISMLFIILLVNPSDLGVEIVSKIYLPMVLLNAFGIFIVIVLIEDISNEQEKEVGKQIKLAMDIATQTLPYFRRPTKESTTKVCEIIQKNLNAQLVAITNRKVVVASAAQDNTYEINHREIRSEYTKRVIREGKLLFSQQDLDKNEMFYYNSKIQSVIIAPLITDGKVEGTLKLYFNKSSYITDRNRYLIEGLSQLISNQMELSQIEQLKEMAAKSEIKALQAQISPHFLFNTLNAISSFIRFDSKKARELIQNLAVYLRYTIEDKSELVTLKEELNQIKAYSNIELARFKGNLIVEYHIPQEALDIKLPPLTLQPLVENAIKHGALTSIDIGRVLVEVLDKKDKFKIVISDNGIGIDPSKIEALYKGERIDNRIGLYNVHRRLSLLYGKGLKIERINGTKISFELEKEDEK